MVMSSLLHIVYSMYKHVGNEVAEEEWLWLVITLAGSPPEAMMGQPYPNLAWNSYLHCNQNRLGSDWRATLRKGISYFFSLPLYPATAWGILWSMLVKPLVQIRNCGLGYGHFCSQSHPFLGPDPPSVLLSPNPERPSPHLQNVLPSPSSTLCLTLRLPRNGLQRYNLRDEKNR